MTDTLGRVAAIWRYPIKSFRGEQVAVADVTASGLAGDRAYALQDRVTARVMSGKRWAGLFGNAGVYATIALRGAIRVGDSVTLG